MSGRDAYDKAVYLLSEADRPPYPGNTRAVLAGAAALVSIAGSLREIAVGLTRYTVGGTNTDRGHTPNGAAEAWNTRAERTCHLVRHGSLADWPEIVCWSCSECSFGWHHDINDMQFSYCPNCGARVEP